MEEPMAINICLTCLSADRRLVPLHKIKVILQEIHFVELKESRGGVCWECWSILAKYYRFKKRAETAQDILLQTTEIWMSWLDIKSVIQFSLDSLNVPKRSANVQELLRRVMGEIRRKYLDHYKLFTDGSKDLSGVGAAFLDPQANINMKFKLNAGICVMRAELIAIVEALSYARQKWECLFDEISTAKGIWYKSIQNAPPTAPWFDGVLFSRETLVTALRLRSGHVPLNKFYHLVGVKSSPLCETCQKPEDFIHILMECDRYRDLRSRILHDVNLHNGSINILLSSPLAQNFNIKSLTTLTTKTNILFDHEFVFDFDPLTNCNTKPKAEPVCIKQEIIDQSDDNLDNTSDLDEKPKEVPEVIENVYVDIIDPKHTENLLRKQETSTKDEMVVSNNFIQVINETDEKLSEITENIENVYVETIETKPYKRLLRKTIKRYKKGIKDNKKKVRKTIKNAETDEKEFQEKFVEVVLTEEEMVRIREEKRNHHNFKKIPYKCDSCVLGFTRKETYSIHVKKKHDESIGDHLCDVCSIRFPNKPAATKHKRKHYVCYRCRLCKYEAHEFWSALNHCKIKHVADKPDRIHCSQCDTVVKTPEDLEDHIQTEHTLYCNECGVKFKGKSTLRRHKARIHSVVRDFICDICTKTFKTKMRLESHMVKHNANIAKKLAYCHLCNVQYKNIYVFRNHLKSSANHSERVYPCPECNKKFASKVYWTKHYNFYHLQKSQFNCEICNKLFISDWRLKNHKQKHHGLSRSRDHTCNICSKKFFTLTTLRSHQLTHSDQRSYMCEDCGDTFKQRAALYTHTRLVHRGGGRRK